MCGAAKRSTLVTQMQSLNLADVEVYETGEMGQCVKRARHDLAVQRINRSFEVPVPYIRRDQRRGALMYVVSA